VCGVLGGGEVRGRLAIDAFGVVPSAGRIRDYFEVDAIYAAGIGLSTLIATISGGSNAA
jgi:hypothetical protein